MSGASASDLVPSGELGGNSTHKRHEISLAIGQQVHISGTVSGSYSDQTLCQETDASAAETVVGGAAINVPYSTAYQVHGATGKLGALMNLRFVL